MEFEIDGTRYQFRPMDAFTQMDVFTKLSPVLASGIVEIFPLLQEAKTRGFAGIMDLPREEVISRTPAIAREIAKTTGEDRRFIIAACLSLCERKIPGEGHGWAPVWSHDAYGGRAMHEDLQYDWWLMVRVCFGVLSNTPSFMRFFPASP